MEAGVRICVFGYMWGLVLGYRVWGLGFRFRVWGFKVWGSGFRVKPLYLHRVRGYGGAGFRGLCNPLLFNDSEAGSRKPNTP